MPDPRLCLLILAIAAPLFAQPFDPTPPPGVPAVEGPIREAFALRWIDVTSGSGETATPRSIAYARMTGRTPPW